ncbi:MAG: PRD domain-containing protein [Bulleidia sp.]
MYKVRKVLNNNAVLVINTDTMREVIFIGTGIGFGKKTNMILQVDEERVSRYVQQKGVDITSQVADKDAVYLEITDQIISQAKNSFDHFDTGILLTLADHIAFAINRIRSGMVISNPFRNDIRLMFPEEYAIAERSRDIIREKTGIEINEDEVSYITLHLHSARSDIRIDQTLLLATLIRESIQEIQSSLGIRINEQSLSYSRLLTHLKYLLLRCNMKEKLRIDMDAFTRKNFPVSYEAAGKIVRKLENHMHLRIDDMEVGYLAIHIERICSDTE